MSEEPLKQATGGRCLGKRDESKIDSLAAGQGSHLRSRPVRDKQPITAPSDTPGGSRPANPSTPDDHTALIPHRDPAIQTKGVSRCPQRARSLTTGSLLPTAGDKGGCRVWDRLAICRAAIGDGGCSILASWESGQMRQAGSGGRHERSRERVWRRENGTCEGRAQKHATRHAGSLPSTHLEQYFPCLVLSLDRPCYCAIAIVTVVALAGPL